MLKKKFFKKIVFFTGARSDFSILEGVMKQFVRLKNVKIYLYISGIHTLRDFGLSKKLIQDFRKVSKRTISIYGKKNNYTKIKLKFIIKRFQKELSKDKPDIIYILGDRFEAMGASIAAKSLNIPIIHSGGGDKTPGSKDEFYRNTISSLSSVIFATNQFSYERLKKKFKNKIIKFTGSPIISKIYNYKSKNKKKNKKKLKFALLTFHPTDNLKENIHKIMEKIISYLIYINMKVIITYPNNETGCYKIIRVIKKFSKNKRIEIYKNLGNLYFEKLDKCEFLIGNSSSGIIEAPYFNKPFINVGKRQFNRDHDTNVISTGINFKKIKQSIDKFKIKKKKIQNNFIFGKINACEIQKKEILKFLS